MLSGPILILPVSSTFAIEPPPAPISNKSIDGILRGKPLPFLLMSDLAISNFLSLMAFPFFK